MPDGVHIDTDGVGEVGRGLRGEADDGFAGVARRGAGLHRRGVEFGGSLTPSAVVTEAKQRYAAALADVEANLRAHHAAAVQLAGAAEEIARLFASADMGSAQAQQRLQWLLDNATRVPEKPLYGPWVDEVVVSAQEAAEPVVGPVVYGPFVGEGPSVAPELKVDEAS